ncbi:CsbD family protein [Streptomyces sp. NPDC001549]|uniref:CsbD family protein n=1 Tax=Streptomyces sp. NPDC001549 TaxID=3364586 RepID=UPI003689D2A8
MGIAQRIRNKMHALQGRITDSTGLTTHNKRSAGRAKADRAAGNLKQSGEKIKNAFRR